MKLIEKLCCRISLLESNACADNKYIEVLKQENNRLRMALEKIADKSYEAEDAEPTYKGELHHKRMVIVELTDIAKSALLQGKDECPEQKQEHNYPQPNPLCPDCKGTGKFLSDKCLKCQGEGYVIDRLMGKGLTCPNCKGTGEDPQDSLGDPVNCHKCDGTGEVEKERGQMSIQDCKCEDKNTKYHLTVCCKGMKHEDGTLNKSDFYKEIEQVINRYSKENDSNTPDWVLAEYLERSLGAFNACINLRERYYGRAK
jgi:hypothetical protein